MLKIFINERLSEWGEGVWGKMKFANFKDLMHKNATTLQNYELNEIEKKLPSCMFLIPIK